MSKILLIEDETELLETVAEWLQFESYTVFQATNGREGLALALQEQPDLIVCDVMMPELDGYGVLAEVRACAATAVIPFIFLTALADRRDLRQGMDSGADDYLTKPFTRDELLNAVQSRLARQAMNQRQSETALNEFRETVLRTLPHELRTPLTAVIGSGELLSSSAAWFSQGELEEMGQLIVKSGERLLHLIENYLFLIELEARESKPLLEDQAAEASELLGETAQQVAKQYERLADLSLTVETAVLNLSSRDWRKIIFELIDNAFKFSMAGTPVVVRGQQASDHYTLSVSDLGRGLKAEDAQKIAPYVQFGRQKYEQQGSGLGLAIVKRVLELCGGRLSVTSAEDQGTTFLLTIPLA